MAKLTGNKPVMIGTDQNFDLMKLDTSNSITDLLNIYLSSSLIQYKSRLSS